MGAGATPLSAEFWLYIVMVRVYHRQFGVPESNCKFMCYAIPFLFVYLIDPEAKTYTV